MKKRIISILLAVAILCAMLPQISSFANAATYSGTCGENLKWTLDTNTGLLSVTGSGWMPDYTNMNASTVCPWADYRESIKMVSLPEGLTHIGIEAFYGCENLQKITIPDSVTSIGREAFSGCKEMESVSVGRGLGSIASNVFFGCKAIKSFTILNPNCTIYDRVDTIGYPFLTCIYGYNYSTAQTYAEKYGYEFQSLGWSDQNPGNELYNYLLDYYFTNNIQTRCFYRFYSDGTFEEYYYDYSDPYFDERNTTEEHLILNTSGSRKYEIKNNALYLYTTISGTKYTSILNPVLKSDPIDWDPGMAWPSVLDANEYFFYETSFITPDSFVDDNAMWLMRAMPTEKKHSGKLFGDTFWTLDEVTGKLTISGTGEINFSDPNQDGVYSPPWEHYRKQIKEIIIQEGVTSIGDDSVFSDCVNAVRISLPQSLKKIGWGAFMRCRSLRNIELPSSLSEILASFSQCSRLNEIVIPKSVTHLGAGSFDECINLKKIIIENPNCSIDGFSTTLGDKSVTTIYGFENSTAQTHAEKFGYTFMLLEENQDIGDTPQTRFSVWKDGWSFSNSSFSFTDNYSERSNYYIPESRYTAVFGPAGTDRFNHNIDSNTGKHKWGGNCAGMSATALLFHKGLLDWNSIDRLFTNSFATPNSYYYRINWFNALDKHYYVSSGFNQEVTRLIEEYQLFTNEKLKSDYPDSPQKQMLNSSFMIKRDTYDGPFNSTSVFGIRTEEEGGTYIQQALDTFSAAYNNNTPLFIGITANGYGHAIVMRTDREPTKMGNGWWRVYVYDPNKPYVNDEIITEIQESDNDAVFYRACNSTVNSGDDFYMELHPKKNLWRYCTSQNSSVAEDYVGCTPSEKINYISIADTLQPEYFLIYSVEDISPTADYSHPKLSVAEWCGSTDTVQIRFDGTSNCKIYDANGDYLAVVEDGKCGRISDSVDTFVTDYDAATGCQSVLYLSNIPVQIDYESGLLDFYGNYNIQHVSADFPANILVNNAENSVFIEAEAGGDASVTCINVAEDGLFSSVECSGELSKNQTLSLSFDDENHISAETDGSGEIELWYKTPEEEEAKPIGNVDVVLAPCDGGVNCPSSKFIDVNQKEWYHPYVDYAVSHGLFGGTSANTFEPETAMTRAMLVTVLWRYEGQPKGYKNTFTDVNAKNGSWYIDAVAWAAANNIVGGIGGGKFDPDGIVTREQMATILYRYSEQKGFDTSKRADFSSFPDANKVSSWAKTAMKWAVAEGLIGGSKEGNKTYLLPTNGATRAQVATILMRYIQGLTEESPYDPMGHSYEYVRGMYSWAQAQKIAEEKGGYLVRFDSLREFNYIATQLSKNEYQNTVFVIGARRAESSKDYYFVDFNDKPVGGKINDSSWFSSCWAAGEPTYEWDGMQEWILAMEYDSSHSTWKINDIVDNLGYPSDPNCHGFIIEYDNKDDLAPEESYHVALITDYGDINDASYNQAAYEAGRAWCEENSADFTYYKPFEDSTEARVAAIDQAVADGYNVLILPGFTFAEAIIETAELYPDVRFIGLDISEDDFRYAIDYYYDNPTYTCPSNVFCALYKEEIGGFMAGYAAVKLGYTRLGFLGGMPVPAVVRYGYGFIQGVDRASTELGIKTEIRYAYGNQFYGDADITAYMDNWYRSGTQVVFACGGGIFTSAAEAAQKYSGKLIGLDVDQASMIDGLYGSGMTVTSAMKGLGETVTFMLDELINGRWNVHGGKIETLGLISGSDPSANFVQLPDSTQWNSGFTKTDYTALVSKIYNGTYIVSADIDTMPTTKSVTVLNEGAIKS